MQPSDKNNWIYNHWTQSSIECFEANCRCSRCGKYEICYSKTEFSINEYGIKPLKYTVLKLFARHGKPRKEENEQMENN